MNEITASKIQTICRGGNKPKPADWDKYKGIMPLNPFSPTINFPEVRPKWWWLLPLLIGGAVGAGA